MYASHVPQDASTLALFTFIPEGLIHWTGVAVMVALVLAGVVGITSMARRVAHSEGVSLPTLFGGRAQLSNAGKAIWSALGVEALGQNRYRQDCKDDNPAEPLYRRRWLIHALTIWGFLGLLAATILDWGLALIGVALRTGARA